MTHAPGPRAAARRVLARARDHGVRYAALDAALRLARRAEARLHDAVLESEAARGVLGPAHLAWRGNSADDNRERWNGWDWSARGEEWTASPAWKDALVADVLESVVAPGTVVLEIGPGAGRWTQHLLPRASRVVAVDVAQAPLDVLARRFAGEGRLETRLGDGRTLPGVADASIDAVWSFDVFVHVAPADQAAYLAEVARVLRPGGVAAIHHADGRNRGTVPSRAGWRTPMTAPLFAALAQSHGLRVERRIREWGDGHGLEPFHDVITVLRRT